MIKLTSTLQHMNIPAHSVNMAIREVRGKIERSSSETAGASNIIKALLDLDIKFDHPDKARVTALSVVQQVIEALDNTVVPEDVLVKAKRRADDFVDAPNNAWMFVKEAIAGPAVGEQTALIDGISTKVAVRSDGSIKKGGKKILAREIYLQMMAISAPVVKTEFQNRLMADVGMTKAGARTYTQDLDKEFNPKSV